MILRCYELIGFMSSALATEILDYAYTSDKDLYRTTLATIADAKRVRPLFLQRKPRGERHTDMLAMLAKPRMDEAATQLLSAWLLKANRDMLTEFLDALGIPHDQGAIKEFPKSIDEEKLQSAVNQLLSKYPQEKVVVYLNTFRATSDTPWPALDAMLETNERLQLS